METWIPLLEMSESLHMPMPALSFQQQQNVINGSAER